MDYASEIQPILAEHCLECHGTDEAKGGLDLSSADFAKQVLESGSPATEEIVARIRHTDPKEKMPPAKKKPLSAAEVEKIAAWIKEGARMEQHWAYRPLAATPAADERAAAARIDEMVGKKLATEGLKGSAQAEAVVLYKRLNYDLLGLPPAVEDVDKFLDAASKDLDAAYAQAIDDLMRSPHFGERWGRHWLDAARYADSDGYEKDRPRPDAWRYRDWVIGAVNADMPFDQFTIEQLAGDLLPDPTPEQIVATAFNRQTLTNTEGGTDQEQFRVEACMDRTETLGTVWLGLTVGCARCHSHKYDKITQVEYYQLYSFFNNADEVVRQAPRSMEEWKTYEAKNGAAAKQLATLQKKVDQAKAALPVKLPEWEEKVKAARAEAKATAQSFAVLLITELTSSTKWVKQPDESWKMTGKVPQRDTLTIATKPTTAPVKAIKLEIFPAGTDKKSSRNFVLSELIIEADGRVLTQHSHVADFSQAKFAAKDVNDGKDDNGWAVSGQTEKPHHLIVQLWDEVPAGKTLRVTMKHLYKQANHVPAQVRLQSSADVTPDSIAPAEVVKILNEEPKRRNPVVIQPLWDFMAKVDPDVVAATRQLEAARARLPEPPLMDVRVIADRANNPRQTRLLHRGDFLSPADEVQPAALKVLPPLPSAKPTRLDLARWLASKENPLTPRVVANQMWSKLFGEGLVTTVADFGVRGEKPSHPELLDFIARQFIELGWSRKRFLKMVMLSKTYRQSSEYRVGGIETEKDPLNRLLWRQNRLRVEGEVVRDLHLAASGLLSRKVGGPSVFPVMPPDIADLSYANNFKWATSTGEDRYRRGLYTFFKRTAPHPDLTTFDCPDANLTNVKRTVSNTPLQALTTLNSETYADAAKALAMRVLDKGTDDRSRLELAFRHCLSRKPSSSELDALGSLLNDSKKHYGKDELAAWAATTRIILNTDEFITRE